MRLGFITEAKLLEALQEQTGCPPVTALELATAPREVRALLPPSLAKRHMAVPFNRQGRNLDVAMLNPNDLVLLDELGRLTGMVIRPHVATEAALTAALALPVAREAPPPPGPPRGQTREWRRFWRPEATLPELVRALSAPPWSPPPFPGATFPQLAPLSAPLPILSETLDDLAEALAQVTHRDQVGEVVLSYLAPRVNRAVLFSLHHGKVMGWMGRGENLVSEDLHSLILPLDRPSLFLNLTKGLDFHAGPLGGGEGNDLLREALGEPEPQGAAVIPVRVRGKVVAFLWADNGEAGVAGLPLPELREVARMTGLALEVLVLRQKIKATPVLTEAAQEG